MGAEGGPVGRVIIRREKLGGGDSVMKEKRAAERLSKTLITS